jgi:hypothetical protein
MILTSLLASFRAPGDHQSLPRAIVTDYHWVRFVAERGVVRRSSSARTIVTDYRWVRFVAERGFVRRSSSPGTIAPNCHWVCFAPERGLVRCRWSGSWASGRSRRSGRGSDHTEMAILKTLLASFRASNERSAGRVLPGQGDPLDRLDPRPEGTWDTSPGQRPGSPDGAGPIRTIARKGRSLRFVGGRRPPKALGWIPPPRWGGSGNRVPVPTGGTRRSMPVVAPRNRYRLPLGSFRRGAWRRSASVVCPRNRYRLPLGSFRRGAWPRSARSTLARTIGTDCHWLCFAPELGFVRREARGSIAVENVRERGRVAKEPGDLGTDRHD